MKLPRLQRLLKLLGLLQAGRGFHVEWLAQECGVSRRTIFRDLETLRVAGIPVAYDEQKERYHVAETFFLPPTNFTAEEALAMIVLCHDLGDHARLPFLAPAQSAALKLESNLPARLREQIRDTADAVQIRMAPANPLAGQEPIFDQLLEAIARRRGVRIRYHSLHEQEGISTRLSPYRLLFKGRSWYVIGRSSLHRAKRTFNVGRILDLEPLDDHFTIPRGFSVERYLRNAWSLIPEKGPDQEVVIRFNPKVAHNVAEVNWHKTQRTRLNLDGTLDFRATVSGLNEISWWILGYGDQAEVLQPEALRRIVAGHARRMVARYDGEA